MTTQRNIEDLYALSPIQAGMLFHSVAGDGDDVYLRQLTCELRGPLSRGAFRRAWQGLVDRHAALRTAFFWHGLDRPMQAVQRRVELPFDSEDWRDLPEADLEAAWRERIEEERRRGLNLSRAPLLRVLLVRVGEDEHRLLWTFHHLILDGWSLGIVVEELLEIYSAYEEGRPSTLRPAPRFRDYFEWIEAQDRVEMEAFWRNWLADPPVPAECPAGGGLPPEGGAAVPDLALSEVRLSPSDTRALHRFARSTGVTTSTLLHAAWGILLGRHGGTADVVFGTVSSGRSAGVQGIESLVGVVMHTFPVRILLEPGRQLLPWLRDVQSRLSAARSFETAPLNDIRRWSGIDGRTPLFSTLLAFENYRRAEASDGDEAGGRAGLKLRSVRSDSRTNYPLSVTVHPGEALTVKVLYDRARFEATTATRLTSHLGNLLRSMPLHSGRPVRDLPMLGSAERHQVAREWVGAARRPCPWSEPVHRLIAEQAARSPDREAIQEGGESWSYRELEIRSNRLARLLLRRGARKGRRVGLLLEPSRSFVLSVLGVLKSGAAYVPLEPQHPPAHVGRILEDAEPALLVTERAHADRLGGMAERLLVLEDAADEIEAEEPGPLVDEVSPEDLAYLVYTSGSTGRPKGVEVSHRALASYLRWAANEYVRGESVAFALYTSPAFDLTVTSVFVPLLTGNRIVVYAREGAHPSILEVLREDRVGVLKLTPGHLRLLCEHGAEPRRLCRLIVGGEAFEGGLAHETHALLGGRVEIYNEYGPTESTVGCVVHRFEPASDPRRPVPIGGPIAGTRAYVLDAEHDHTPIGAVGELYLAGAGQARGYRRRPGRTAQAFVPDPFGGEPGGRLYRTGDLARRRAGGEMEFRGRRDHQVKVRGFRIELGEIEAALSDHPRIRQCAVAARERTSGQQQLVAYVVSRDGEPLEDLELRAFLGQRLPGYMVPPRFVFLDALPLTTNGKVDRRSLPQPATGSPDEPAGVTAGPSSPIEDLVAGAFAEITDTVVSSGEEDFFELGGDSLQAMQVMARMRKLLGLDLPVSLLFEAPTVAAFAERVRRSLEERASGPLPPIERVPRTEPQPLSAEQKRLWLFERLVPGTPAYNVPSAVRLQGELRFHTLDQVVGELVRRHEALRTRFRELAGEPVQEIEAEARPDFAVADLGGLAAAEAEDEVRRLAHEEALRPFDLGQGGLSRLRMLRLGDADAVLLFTLHHIVSDAWSMGVLNRDVGRLYPALAAGVPSPVEDLPAQYLDYAAWQRDVLSSPILHRQIDYWRGRLEGDWPRLRLPYDRTRPPRPRFRGALERLDLPAELSARLLALSRREGVTLFMSVLALYLALLHRYTGQEDLCVGTSLAGRDRPEWEEIVGYLVTTLPLRTDLAGDPTFRELLRRVREVTLGAFAHRAVPLERVVEELDLGRREGLLSMFQAFLVLHNTPYEAVDLEGLSLRPVAATAYRSKFDLTLRVTPDPSGLQLLFEYDRDLFTPGTIAGMRDTFEALAGSVVEDPERPLSWLADDLEPGAEQLLAFNEDLEQAV